MKCISLLTDFGEQDGFVGVMKGVIYGIAPKTRIVDLSHLVQPQNIFHGAVLLANAYRYFPEGSVHLAVVDPGVGTDRAGLAAQIGSFYFVAPDNGLLTDVYQSAESRKESMRIVRLKNSRFWLPEVSATFHGRDIFAPVAAHLANGVPLEALGPPLEIPVRIEIPRPEPFPDGWVAEVLWIDVYGNIITNLEAREAAGAPIREVRLAGVIVRQMARTFAEAEPGSLAALWDSNGRLSICLVNGNAAQKLDIRTGDKVSVLLHEP